MSSDISEKEYEHSLGGDVSPLTPTRPFSFVGSNVKEEYLSLPRGNFCRFFAHGGEIPEYFPLKSSGNDNSHTPEIGVELDSNKRNSSETTLIASNPEHAWFKEVDLTSDGNEAHHPPKKWPREPRSVKRIDYNKVLEIIGHIILAAAASWIILFASLSTTVNNTYPNSSIKYVPGERVIHRYMKSIQRGTGGDLFSRQDGTTLNSSLLWWAQLGPTIIPAIFSAIVGSSLRLFGRLRAQRGAKLGTLEVLVASKSYSQTLWMMLTLRTSVFLHLGLLILWSLSPLAGQVSLRILNPRNVTDASISIPWHVADTKDKSFWQNQTTLLNKLPVFAAEYLNAMSWNSGTWHDSHGYKYDTDGFPMLPMPNPVKSWSASQIHDRKGLSQYYSLKGIPIHSPSFGSRSTSPYRFEGNLTFPVSMFSFSCSSFPHQSRNTSQRGCFTVNGNASSDDLQSPQNVFFGPTRATQWEFMKWNCTVVLHTRIIGTRCSPKVRPYGIPRNVSRGTGEGDRDRNEQGLCAITDIGVAEISNTTPLRNSHSVIFATLREIELSTTISYLATGSISGGYGDRYFSTVDNSKFSDRLTTVFNTIWLSSLRLKFDKEGKLMPKTASFSMNTTTSTPLFYKPFDVIQCNWNAFVILTTTAALLVLCCFVNIWLVYRLNTPDIFGYISTLTFDNPHFPIPGVEAGSGSTLDGLERTRLLRDVKVRIGEVRKGEEFGKLALAKAGEGVEGVKRRRKYI